jgi:hypothetical protein
MAKRFTDTNKYKKPFIRSLPAAYKLMWDFLYHDCDHAGIWIVDFEIAQAYIGKDAVVSKETSLKMFNEGEIRIVELDGGKKWFIPSFIEFQYGHLSEKNRAHLSVISILQKFDLLNTDFTLKTKIKPLTSPLQGAKDKDKDKEQDMDMEQATIDSKMLTPKMLDVWKKNHPDYPVSMADDLKALRRIAEFICKQSGVSFQPLKNDVQETVMGIWTTMSEFTATDSFYSSLSLKSIYNSIQSLSKKIINGKSGKNGKAPGTKITSADLNAARAKFRGQRESA